VAAEQPPAGLAGNLAGEIPQGEIERPAAAIVERDVVDDPVMALEGERMLADEQVLVAGKAQMVLKINGKPEDNDIHTDSKALIKFTGLMGQNYVSIEGGTPGSPKICSIK